MEDSSLFLTEAKGLAPRPRGLVRGLAESPAELAVTVREFIAR